MPGNGPLGCMGDACPFRCWFSKQDNWSDEFVLALLWRGEQQFELRPVLRRLNALAFRLCHAAHRTRRLATL